MKDDSSMTRSNLLRPLFITAAILMIPLAAMQFSDQVNWGPEDFIVMGLLIFGTGLTYEVYIKRMISPTRRLVAGMLLALAFFLIWAQLAVSLVTKIFTGL